MFSSLFGWRIRSETTAQLMRICCFTDDWARRVRLLCSSAHPCFASTWHDFKKEECLASLASLTQGAQRGSTAARNAGLLYTSESPEQSTDEDHQEDDIEWYPYDYDDYWWDDGDVDTGRSNCLLRNPECVAGRWRRVAPMLSGTSAEANGSKAGNAAPKTTPACL